ncbi:MecKel-Gruber Syndrome (MKS) [Trichostrongylus colubriformis]|uniref:MecKel-Gruber Syndrome (MKS) n=1 Tax=Trichostrongylus colubriformis TaxID=6319 RepID=A0AAN8F4F4_TRICO
MAIASNILLAFLIICLLKVCCGQYSQTLAVPYEVESNCTGNEYYNARTLSCQPCSNGTVPSASKLSCQCPPGSVIIDIAPTGIQCQECPTGLYPSPSSLECVPCKTPPCCPSGSVYVARNANGASSIATSNSSDARNGQCLPCVKGTQPNADGTACEPCGTLDCFCKGNPSMCESTQVLTSPNPTVNLLSGIPTRSSFVAGLLEPTASRCSVGSEEHCQALVNLCVLQNFDTSDGTACDAIENIRTRQPEGPAPALFFLGDADTELHRDPAISQNFMFGNGPAGQLEILLMRYALNGTFLGVTEGSAVLQQCAHSEVHHAFEFGRRYNLTCYLTINQLSCGAGMEFFEAFLKFFDKSGAAQIHPVPILSNLIRSSSGVQLNQLPQKTNSWVLTRRFFIVDDVSLTATNSSPIVRYAKNIGVHVELQTTRDGQIFPPYISIGYAENSENNSVELEITMAVLCPLSVLWAAMKAYSWGRRSGKASLLDAATIVQFLLYECAALGDVFFVVITAMSCWITFAYKSQTYPFYSILDEDQEWVLMSYLIATACLKLIALLHTILHMVLQETFFIDWERPQIIENSQLARPASRDVSKDRKEMPVVVWRTYFIANEWAELRCVRATSIGLQLLIILLLLEAFDFMRFSFVQPGFGDGSPSSESTILTRFAVVIFFYVIVGFLQWAIQVAIVERMITDPFHNFIDLCSIANISVLALSHPLHGHYIHGRSPHGRADTGMAEMNEFLQKEQDDLCGFRGLEPTSHLQTFVVSLPVNLRKRYDEIMITMRNSSAQTRLSGLDQTTAKMAATVQAREQINVLFREFIDHSTTDMDYTIRDRSFAEALLDTELNDTSQMGNFLRDPSEVGFSQCFLYGREWAHFSFEATLFALLFIWLGSLPFAAAIVFCFTHDQARIGDAAPYQHHLEGIAEVDEQILAEEHDVPDVSWSSAPNPESGVI